MFVGENYHQIDDKGRIRIPTKYKNELDTNPFIMQGVERCLYVYPKKFADEMLGNVFANGRFNDREMNAEKAMLMSKACYGEEDKQGRITLPQKLLRYAKISVSSTIVTVGAYDHIQIWDKDEWERFCEAADSNEENN